MNTFEEIQEAVTRLRRDEKKALSLWLNSQTEPEMSSEEEQQLLHSLGQAARDLDAGKGVSLEEARKRVTSWVYQIIFSPQSLSDLEKIVRRISKDNPSAAERIGNALIDRVLILKNFLQLGSAYAKRPNVRSVAPLHNFLSH